jgi:hypothetical protein
VVGQRRLRRWMSNKMHAAEPREVGFEMRKCRQKLESVERAGSVFVGRGVGALNAVHTLDEDRGGVCSELQDAPKGSERCGLKVCM